MCVEGGNICLHTFNLTWKKSFIYLWILIISVYIVRGIAFKDLFIVRFCMEVNSLCPWVVVCLAHTHLYLHVNHRTIVHCPFLLFFGLIRLLAHDISDISGHVHISFTR